MVCVDQTDKEGNSIYPGAREQIEKIWEYYYRRSQSPRILSPEHAQKIRQMFAWSWIRKIQLGPVLAAKAAEIARNTGIKPCDAVHVASALHRDCSVIHRWDHDFKKTEHLIHSEEPKMLSPANLFSLGSPESI
jgi:predicted nucleic acid-binding protein